MNRISPGQILPTVVFLSLLVSGSAHGQQAVRPADVDNQTAAWWNADWACRRTVTVQSTAALSQVAAVELPTLGRVRPDGADVRVVSGGAVLNHHLLWTDPDDRLKLVFEVPAATKSVHVYFDNPKAKPVPNWTPPAGLIMETRRYVGAPVRSLRQFRRALGKAKKLCGRDLVGRVHFGHNPFGTAENFLSRFSGYLLCPAEGVYEFATTSDDASFLLIDGAQICAWPGEHPAARDARHKGRVTLTRGVHRFEYYHQQIRGRCCMVAAWKPPGRKMRVIPASAFVPVRTAKPGRLELRSGKWLPDFLAHNIGEAVLRPEADRYLVRIRFENLTDEKRMKNRKVIWRFGDGTASNEVSPEHVYLVEGTYEVTLRVLDGYREHSVTARVRARRRPSRQAANIDSRQDYYEIIRAYDLALMPIRHVYWAMYYFDRIGRFNDVVAAGREVVSRTGVTDEPMLFAAVMLLGETERVHGRDYRRVRKLYADFEKRMKQPTHAAVLALARGDIWHWHLKDLTRAEGCYRRILTDYRGRAEPATVRKALFRLGEIYRWRGDGLKTREFFERAQSIPCDKLSETRRSVRPGYFARAIEDYIRSGQMNDAHEFLVQWAWEFPTDMLEGYWSVLRIRWLYKNAEYEGGVSEAETLLKMNPQSAYAVGALMLGADCAEALKQPERARKLLRRALVEYPESPLRGVVGTRLAGVK